MAEEMELKFRQVAEYVYLEYNDVRNTFSAPIIVAMKGNHFTGRELVAFYVASILRCPLIKVKNFCNYEKKLEENHENIWRKIYNLALSQLIEGRSVVIDTELAKQIEFDKLKELSVLTKTPLVVFECRMELAEDLWDTLSEYEHKNDPVTYIFHQFMKKPVSQYINSTNVNMGEIPVILVQQERLRYFCTSVYSAFMDLKDHIFPTFESQKENNCDHLFKFTNIENECKIHCCQCRQLVSGSVYRCRKCRTIFHTTCSYFPKSLSVANFFMEDEGTLDLRHVQELDADASCICCKQLLRSSNSSLYYSNEHGDVLYDLECLFLLPAKLLTKLHKHELVRAIYNNPMRCHECDTIIVKNTICYLCRQCSISFDVFCLWLPDMVQVNRDRHPLKLSVIPRADSDPYFCHGCENERDVDKWIYYCEECDFQNHPRCIVKEPCLPRSLITKISKSSKNSKEKFPDIELQSCGSHLVTEKVMAEEPPLHHRSEVESLEVFKESTKDINLPIIITTKGQSTARKLVASTLATIFSCLLIEEDNLSDDTNELHAFYHQVYQIAPSQLQIGLSVVIDCDLKNGVDFDILRKMAFNTVTPLFIVEFNSFVNSSFDDFPYFPDRVSLQPSYDYNVSNTPKIVVDVTAPTFDEVNNLMPRILHSISAYSKEWSTVHTKNSLIESCYRHDVRVQKDDDVLEGDICNRCSMQISYPILICEKCGLILHETCTVLPSRITLGGTFPFHLEKGNPDDPYDHSYYVFKDDDSYISFLVKNLFRPMKPRINPHEHPLRLSIDFEFFQCGACGLHSQHKLCYSCSFEGCGFRIGVACGFLEETVTFDRHCHPFQLIVSPEHVSNQYYCDVCQEERDKNHWVYGCVPCDYFIHVCCLVSETARCRSSEYYDDEIADDDKIADDDEIADADDELNYYLNFPC